MLIRSVDLEFSAFDRFSCFLAVLSQFQIPVKIEADILGHIPIRMFGRMQEELLCIVRSVISIEVVILLIRFRDLSRYP